MPNEKEMPDWTKKIESWGDHFWGKRESEKKNTQRSNKSAYISSIIINAVLIFVVNNLLNWHIPQLTHEFIIPLWILDISFGASILFNLVFLIYDQKWFRTLLQVFLNVISLAAVSALIELFPFSVSAHHGYLIKIVLLIILVGIFIAIAIEVIKLVIYTTRFLLKVF